MRVVAQEARLDVAVHEEVALEPTQQRQPRAGERYIQLDLEGGGSEDQCADLRRVVVRPCRCNNGAHALRDHCHVLFGNIKRDAQVIDKGLHVANAGGKARAVTTGAWRLTVTAGIPGKKIKPWQVQFIDQMRDPPGMLVAAMEQQHGLPWRIRRRACGRPVAVEQLDAIVGGEALIIHITHCDFLMPVRCFDYCWEEGASLRPRRTRLNRVYTSRAQTMSRITFIHRAGSQPMATPAPSTPKTSARSLLPIGPS